MALAKAVSDEIASFGGAEFTTFAVDDRAVECVGEFDRVFGDFSGVEVPDLWGASYASGKIAALTWLTCVPDMYAATLSAIAAVLIDDAMAQLHADAEAQGQTVDAADLEHLERAQGVLPLGRLTGPEQYCVIDSAPLLLADAPRLHGEWSMLYDEHATEVLLRLWLPCASTWTAKALLFLSPYVPYVYEAEQLPSDDSIECLGSLLGRFGINAEVFSGEASLSDGISTAWTICAPESQEDLAVLHDYGFLYDLAPDEIPMMGADQEACAVRWIDALAAHIPEDAAKRLHSLYSPVSAAKLACASEEYLRAQLALLEAPAELFDAEAQSCTSRISADFERALQAGTADALDAYFGEWYWHSGEADFSPARTRLEYVVHGCVPELPLAWELASRELTVDAITSQQWKCVLDEYAGAELDAALLWSSIVADFPPHDDYYYRYDDPAVQKLEAIGDRCLS